MSEETKTLPVVSNINFESSPSIGKIVEALSKAQAVMEPAVMDMVNPHYKSQYASLTSVKNSYQKPLSENGLCLTHQVFSIQQNYYVRTMLAHTSGEYFANTLKLLVGRQDMQGLGSAITYAKRYSASAMLDIVDTEDDDGNGSLPPKPDQNNKNKPQQKPELPNHAPGALSQAQLKRLYAIGLGRSWSSEYLRMKVYSMYKKTPSELDMKQYETLCTNFESRVFNAKDKAELDHFAQNLSPEAYQKVTGKKLDSPPPEFDQSEEMPDYDDLPNYEPT